MSDLQSRTRYEPSAVEPRIVTQWLESGLFHPDPVGSASENYSIAIPPPNVTGSLHMGHALNGAIQDTLIRFHRMRGERAKWILGTDHAGIATQTQVEKQLVTEGTSREAIGREEFERRVWEWREQHGSRIIEQLQRLGASCDYEDERFTLDEGYVRAVMKVFVDLHDRGLIYRDRYMVNWDPGTGSAISDLEVEEREVVDTLYSIDYDLEDGGRVTVATVRPETMLADTAIAVHPDDHRYRDLVGRTAILPLVGRRLPIVADDFVRPEFGTGALKITPGHDPNDFEIGARHELEQISVIEEDGTLNDAGGERYAGLAIMEARERVVVDLEAEGRISAREEHRHEVPYSHRSGERIEPLISLQWFMRMDELAQPAIDAVTSGRVRIHPDNHRRVYLDWMENIRPWCISRQIWWGHRLPVYYCDECEETHVSAEPPERCSACGGPLRRDEDVLDTWFSSALWPFATLGWPENTPALRAFYPTDVLLTARDILFLWVARMIMLALEFVGEIPFADVYVHSIIQAPDGRRMSKSLGTGVDPVDLIGGGPRPPVFAAGPNGRARPTKPRDAGEFPPYGADAVRFGLLAMSSAQDVRFNEEKVAQGQQLTNKLWNASRFVLLNLEEGSTPAPRPQTPEDHWILSRLQRAKTETARLIESYDFSHAALGLYDFVYGELCDWYIELVKPRLHDDGADRAALSATLLHVISETLALAHPLIPFVTEEIWSFLPGAEGLLAGEVAAPPDPALVDPAVEEELGRTIAAVQALRGWRDRVGCRPADLIRGRLDATGYERTSAQVARLARFEIGDDGGDPVDAVPVPGGTMHVLAGGAFDPEVAARRREEQRAGIESEIARSEGKLANEGFVAKAPAAVVGAEREKLERLRAELAAL